VTTTPTYRSFLGIAKEATRGTALVPTDYIPVKKMDFTDDIVQLKDQSMRGSMAETYGQVQGPSQGTYTLDGDVFMDTIGYPLAGILGDYAVTGATPPYVHTMALLNSGTGQPTSYTLTDSNGVQARAMAGAQFSELAFKFAAEGMLGWSAKANGYASATASTPTPSWSTIKPSAAWTGVVSVAGSPVAAALDGEVSIKRKIDVIHTVQNLQSPYRVQVGPLTVTGKLTFTMEDETQLLNYLNGTQPILDVIWSTGAGAALTSLQLHMTIGAYDKGSTSRGKNYLTVPIEFEAAANATDVGASTGFSPIKATLKNAKTTAVFA
jgi:hypothetical protein